VRNVVLTRDDALALADEASARLLGAANVNSPGPQLSELETTSVEAYRHYMVAMDAGRTGRLSEGVLELDAAIALDSGFIAAIRARIDAAIGARDTSLVRRLRIAMRAHADRATDFDRLSQDATDAYYSGKREESEALARRLLRRYPRDPRAYQMLKGILDSHGALDEAEQVALQALRLDSLAIEAGSGPCTQCNGFANLVGLHWARNDLRGASAWARQWIRAQPDGASAWAALAWTFSYLQMPDSALPLMQRAASLAGGDQWTTIELARMLLVARRYEAADSVIATMDSTASSAARETVADLRGTVARERGRVREATRIIDRLADSPASAGFLEMSRAQSLRALGDYAQAARRYEAPAHSPNEGRLTFPLPATSARAFCWHHALAADARAPDGNVAWLAAVADTLAAACGNSYYGRDWRLHHHVRGLIAMHERRFAEAEREFAQAVWSPVEGWGRITVELARAQVALGRPRDAITTLRTGYATRLDAMGRYVPISELDFWMSQTFAQAGESDSARVYAGYVRRAWSNADPEVRRRLAKLP
jgi:tetratricopeptide (TPR) repeat protein